MAAAAEDEGTLSMGTFSKEEAVAQLTALFGEATVAELQDDQWKVQSLVGRRGRGGDTVW